MAQRRSLPRSFLFLFFVTLFSISPQVYGQLTNATLTGFVRDETGGVIPGLEVTARHLATNVTRSTITNDSGSYRLPNLPVGDYEVRAELPGFKTTVVAVSVTVAEVRTLDMTMTVGEISDMVEVKADVAAVNTSEGRISSVIETQQVTELPLLSRNIYELTELQPGMMRIGGDFDTFTVSRTPAVSANGNRIRGNNFVLDGANNTSPLRASQPIVTPAVDMVEATEVQTNNFAPEFGRGNAMVINVETKRGTNEIHGAAWEFHRNDDLNARNFFDSRRLSLLRHQFGFTVGGPVVKDRFFLFGGYEGSRFPREISSRFAVETAAFRQFVKETRPNNVSTFLFNNFPAPPTIPGTERDIGSPAPGRRVFGPPDGIPDVGLAQLFSAEDSETDQFMVRGDYIFNQNDSIFVRWISEDQENLGVSSFFVGTSRGGRGFRNPQDVFLANGIIGYLHTFSANSLNEFRFSYARSRTDLGCNQPLIPDVNIFGLEAGFGCDIFKPDLFTNNVFEWRDIFSTEFGSHGLKFGFEVRRNQENSDHCQFCRGGSFAFANILDFADDEDLIQTVRTDPFTGEFTNARRGFRSTELAGFVQDNWKVTPRFTLNLGLRYDLFGRISEERDLLSNIIFGPGDTPTARIAAARVGRVEKLWDQDTNNLGPRVGFAWDPFGRGDFSVRGGFAIVYQTNSEIFITNSRFNPPDNITAQSFPFLGQPSSFGIPPKFNPFFARGLNEFGGVPGLRISPWAVDPALDNGYTESWFLSLQKKLPGEMVAEASYNGTAGRKLERVLDINRVPGDLLDGQLNRINPNFDRITFVTNGASSIFHGVNLELRRRFTGGFSFQADYRWSKAIDDASDVNSALFLDNPTGNGAVQNVNNLRLERGRSDFDVRHRFTLNGIWKLPSFQQLGAPARAVLGDWEVSGIVRLQSGRPFTVFTTALLAAGGDFNADGGGNPFIPAAFDRPNTPSFGNDKASPTKQQFLNGLFSVADFPRPAPGQDGDLGRNTFSGPGFATADLSLMKNVPLEMIREGVRLQFRAEFFNLFNRVNLFLPQHDLASAASFGKSTRAFDPREIQFGLKFLF